MADDEAGPLLGWSLAAGVGRKPLHDLVDFPCTFEFKAVGTAAADFVSSMLVRVGEVLGRTIGDDEHSVRKSATGRYESVSLRLFVTSGDEVYAIYEAIQADARVKILL